MLAILPCLDSPELADSRRRELQIPRTVAEALGRSAMEAATSGQYRDASGRIVDWSREVEAACSGKRSLPPDETLPSLDRGGFHETRVQVANETTLGASRRFLESGASPLALNFANGVNPGGGFLHGALAQEEALCRSSALYLTLQGDPMYAAHRRRLLPDSTAWCIHSPAVPVFRTDGGTPLERPWPLSFLTCAAPYAPAIGRSASATLLRGRIHRVLEIAQALGYTTLVLGAWGCGAFGNDARRTAEDFREALEDGFQGAFSDIVFAIADWSPERRFLRPFRDVFSGD